MLGRIVRSFWHGLASSRPPLGVSTSAAGSPASGVFVKHIASTEVVDDQKLLELAAEPERPLFPWLRDETSLAPLILLLAALAPAFVTQYHAFNLNDALWGEKALECVAAERVGEFVDPASRDREVPFRWQPPLITWLTALLQLAIGPQRMSGLYVIPALSAAGLIVSAVLFARIWGGARAGLATGLLMAGHPQLVQVAPGAAPWVAGLSLGMVALWGFLRHWNESPKLWSWSLLVSGIAGSFCVLAGGPVAFGLLGVTVLYLTWWACGRQWSAPTSWTVRGVLWGRRKIANSWLIAIALTAIGGGWWIALMLLRYGSPFFFSWLSGRSRFDIAATPPEFASTWFSRLMLLGAPVYLGLSLLGLLRIVADDRTRQDDADWRQRRLLMAWGAVALILWFFSGTVLFQTSDSASAWRAFLIIPLLMLAVVGLIDIADRRLPFETAFGILVATLAWGLVWGTWGTSRDLMASASSSLFWRLCLTILIGCAGWGLFYWARDSRTRQARVLTGLVVTLLSVHMIAGIRGVPALAKSDGIGPGLLDVQESFRTLGGMRHVTLVAQELESTPPASSSATGPFVGSFPQVPPLLRWLVKSHWPRATIATSTSWEQALSSTSTSSLETDAIDKAVLTGKGATSRLKSLSRLESGHSGYLIVIWGPRGYLNIPPTPGPARRHGPVCGIADIDVAVFIVPAPR